VKKNSTIFIVTDWDFIKAFASRNDASKFVTDVKERFKNHPIDWDEWDELLMDDELLDMGVTFTGNFDNKEEIVEILHKNHLKYSKDDIRQQLTIMEDPDISKLELLELSVE